MAGSQDGTLMTVAEAKERLRDLGRESAPAKGMLSSPLVRIGGALLIGTVLGKVGRAGKKEGGGGGNGEKGEWLRSLALQVLASAGPGLLDQLMGLLTAPKKPKSAEPDAG